MDDETVTGELRSIYGSLSEAPIDVAGLAASGRRRGRRRRYRRRAAQVGAAAAVAALLPFGVLVHSGGGTVLVEGASPSRQEYTSSPWSGSGPALTLQTGLTPGSYARTLASVPLTSTVGEATVYFGQLRSLTHALDDEITLKISPSYLAAHPAQCALTVVFRGVTGQEAVVYAQGLVGGFTAAEDAPSRPVSTDGGVVHQQTVVPPEGAGAGLTLAGSGLLVTDGHETKSGSYTLLLVRTSGSDRTWRLNGASVSCSA